MTATTELSLIHRIHGHLALGLLHCKELCVAVLAGEYRCMEFVAEGHIADTLDLIHEFLIEFLHLMASRTF